MTTMKHTILILTLAVFRLTSSAQKQNFEIRDDFKKYYDKFSVEGSFVLYNQKQDKYIFYNNKKLTSYAQNFLIYLVNSNLRNFEKLLAG